MGVWQHSKVLETASADPGHRQPSNSAMIIEVSAVVLRVLEAAAILGIGALLVLLRTDDLPEVMAADHYRLAGLAALIYSAIATATGSYDVDVLFSRKRRASSLLRTWGVTAVFLVTLGFVMKTSTHISREWALLWFFLSGLLLLALRLGFSAWLWSKRKGGRFDVRTAVFGGGEQARRLIDYVTDNESLTIKVVGRFDDRVGRDGDNRGPSLGGISALLRQIREGTVDQVIVALPWAYEDRIQQIVRQLALTPVRIRLAPDLVGFAYMHKPLNLLGELPVLTLFDRPISGLDQSIKWFEDQIIGWLLIIILSPLLLLTAIAIKLDSPGPIFFRQPREGFNDRQFLVWKFRTMRTDACEQDAIVQAQKEDPRVTRVGAFLRRFSIDELPQLFNVVRGDMSLVGPRPHAPSTKAGQRLFRDAVSTYAARHRVKPGITGWAQVRGWRGPTDTEEKLVSRLDHDLYYIENWSVWFDFLILARTAFAITSKNAF